MKRNAIGFCAVCMLIMSVFILGCPADGNKNEGSKNPTPTLDPALRAVPIPTSAAMDPWVIGSYTEGDRNYYLIDVGLIQDVYISTIAIADYNGMTRVSLSKKTITGETITQAVTETVSKSVVISNTQSAKVGLDVAYETKASASLFGLGASTKFSAKLVTEWSGSWTNTNNASKSRETSETIAKSSYEEETLSFTIGEQGEPKGTYRYALYAMCDVYFTISTSLDNKELLSWDTYVCAKGSEYTPHWDYSPNGRFDNSPISGTEITFSEDFYKNLPKPTSGGPTVTPPPNFYLTEWKTIRTDAKRITDSGRFNQPYDLVNFDVFGVNLNNMKQEGYKTISFYFRLNIREIDAGFQQIFLYSSPAKTNDYLISNLQFEHRPGEGKDSNWWVHYESQLKFEDISIDKFVNPEFIIRYGATGNSADTWENKDLKIQLLFKK